MYKVAVKAHSELTGEAQATSLSEKFYYRIPTPAAPLMNIDSQDIKLASQEENKTYTYGDYTFDYQSYCWVDKHGNKYPVYNYDY